MKIMKTLLAVLALLLLVPSVRAGAFLDTKGKSLKNGQVSSKWDAVDRVYTIGTHQHTFSESEVEEAYKLAKAKVDSRDSDKPEDIGTPFTGAAYNAFLDETCQTKYGQSYQEHIHGPSDDYWFLMLSGYYLQAIEKREIGKPGADSQEVTFEEFTGQTDKEKTAFEKGWHAYFLEHNADYLIDPWNADSEKAILKAAAEHNYFKQGYLSRFHFENNSQQAVADDLQKDLDQKRADRKAVGMETEDDKEQDEAEKKARIIRKVQKILNNDDND
jgi:hypothetical protein